MTRLGNQRWLWGRDTYRRPTERIRPVEYDVTEIVGDHEAKAFVVAHHYSRTYPAARVRVGLWRRGQLVGVAVFSHPMSDRVLTNVFPSVAPCSAVELGRFVLLDEVPGNGESWFLARCFEVLRSRGIKGVVSFSDPVPRETATGHVVFPGHLGTIYQAHNGEYLGRGTARTLRLLPDGKVLSARSTQKIRAAERGWHPVTRQLVSHGATAIDPTANRAERLAWLAHWTGRLTHKLRHGGNHRYAWRLNRRVIIAGTPAPYPKRETMTNNDTLVLTPERKTP
jgi:hypothetical protein